MSRLMLGVRRVLRTAAMAGLSKRANVEYWSAINASLGGDGEGLREHIAAEHDGFGIMAAVVLSAVVAILAVAPSNFREANGRNDLARVVLYVALALAFFLAVECIVGAMDFRSQTSKVPAARLLEWVTTFKGSFFFEYMLHMILCLIALSVAAVTLAYLIHGPTAFWIFLGVGCALLAAMWVNSVRVNSMLVNDYLGLPGTEGGGGDGGGGTGKAAVLGGGDGGGGSGPRSVRVAAAVHPLEVSGRPAMTARPAS